MKKMHFWIIGVVVSFLLYFLSQGILTSYAKSYQHIERKTSIEEEVIKATIEKYFEFRYQAHSTLQLEGFETFFSDLKESQDFYSSEKDRLEIELYNAKINQLKYLDYKIFLTFENININLNDQIATVEVIEGHDVVFEVSSPRVSSLRNIQHKFTLKSEEGNWKIISDSNTDVLSKLIDTESRSKNDYLKILDENKSVELDIPYSSDKDSKILPSMTLQNGTRKPYDRYRAALYANEHAYNYNPVYPDFFEDDCTNFVSQAIHEGGGAPMVFLGTSGIGTSGWYLFSVTDRSAAWTHVGSLYNFLVVDKNAIFTGPEGIEVTTQSSLERGDLVQFKWSTNPNLWAHSVMITDVAPGNMNGQYVFYIAAHDTDRRDYPLSAISYSQRRFIKITGIKEDFPISMPLIMKPNGSSNTTASLSTASFAYPAPMVESSSNSVLENNDSQIGYPAP